MILSRALFSFFAIGAIGALAAPSPVVEKRADVGDVLSVIDLFDFETSGLLSQLDTFADSSDADEAEVTAVVQGLVDSTNKATTSLERLGSNVDQSRGGSREQVAKEVSVVYQKIATSVSNFKTKKPHLYPIIPKYGLDAALAKLLFGLNIVIAGVLVLVAALLKVVGGLLAGLGLTLLGGLIGGGYPGYPGYPAPY